MNNTRYVNANGLPDPRQVSTARDIAILSRAVMRDFPQYYGYFSLKSFTYNGRTVVNHNHLLDKAPGVDGLKTGFINASGFNLSASAVRDHHRLIHRGSGRQHRPQPRHPGGATARHRLLDPAPPRSGRADRGRPKTCSIPPTTAPARRPRRRRRPPAVSC